MSNPVIFTEVSTSVSSDTLQTVGRYLEYLARVEQKASKTILNRRHILTPFFRYVESDLLHLTIQEVDSYFMQVNHKPSTVSSERQALRLFFQYCQEYLELPMLFRWEAIKRIKVKPPRVKAFSKQEIAKVIELAPSMQDKLIIALLFETGMRIGELLNLQMADITGNQIQIRGKGEEDRIVVMSPFLATSLRAYLCRRQIVSGHVFRPLQRHVNHPNDRYTSAYAVRDRIKRAFMQVGIEMHPHQLRHSFSIEYLLSGGDLRSLQLLLGHASIETTQRYLGFTDNQLEAIYHRTFTTSVMPQ